MEEIIQQLEQGIKKHSSIDASFRKILIAFLRKNGEDIGVVAHKVKFDMKFFELFTQYLEKNTEGQIIDESNYYKNFNRLKKFGLIHKKSASCFAKRLTLKSINPNHNSLLIDNFSQLDDFTSVRNNVLRLIHINNHESRFYLYIYLRFFALETLTSRQLSTLTIKHVIPLTDELVIHYIEREPNFLNLSSYNYKLYIYDTEVSSVLKNIQEKKDDNLFTEIGEYEKFLLKFKNTYFPSTRIQTLKYLNKNYHFCQNSSLYVTSYQETASTVPLTISELNKLFPGKITEDIMMKEVKLVNKIFNKHHIEQDEIDVIASHQYDEDTISGFSIDEFDELILFMRSKSNLLEKKRIYNIFKEFDLYLKIDDSKHVHMIIQYIRYLLELHVKNKLRASTVRGYVWTLNKHLIKTFLNLDCIQPYELNNLQTRLASGKYKESTRKTILKIVNRFFKYHSKKRISSIQLINYPKSLIFEDELDEILLTIEQKTKRMVHRLGKNEKLFMLQKQVMILLAYYANPRKNELRTRLLSDLYIFDNEIYLDINNQGLRKQKLKLKSNTGKRRIKFSTSKKHFEIIKEWYNLRIQLSNKSKYLFLKRSDTGNFVNTLIDEKVFDEFNTIIKLVTKRYCTFHSLRHSCSTNKIFELIDGSPNPYLLLEHSMEMGHVDPTITLSSYVHANLIRVMKYSNIYNIRKTK